MVMDVILPSRDRSPANVGMSNTKKNVAMVGSV